MNCVFSESGFNQSFSRRQGSFVADMFRGCIGALDGYVVYLVYPPDAPNPQEYRNHKGTYAVILQVTI
jgi:hypothetical protein